MDLQFLQMLQSMAQLEKDPHFCPKQYVIVDDENEHDVDPESKTVNVVLKHPNNVIVVASPTGKAPPSAASETRVNTITEAVQIAVNRHLKNGILAFSVIIDEGMYINPDFSSLWGDKLQKGNFSIEFLGIVFMRSLDNWIFSSAKTSILSCEIFLFSTSPNATTRRLYSEAWMPL